MILSGTEQHRTASDRSPRSPVLMRIDQYFQANLEHMMWCEELYFGPWPLVSFLSKQSCEDGGVGNQPRSQSLPHSQHRNRVWPEQATEERVGKYSCALQHTHGIGDFRFFTTFKRNICQDQRIAKQVTQGFASSENIQIN